MATKKHPLRKPITPLSIIRNALRRLWMVSREQAQARREQKNTCQRCGRKGSVSKDHPCKTHMHHTKGINWQRIDEVIRTELLQTPADYECLCVECHNKEHHGNQTAVSGTPTETPGA